MSNTLFIGKVYHRFDELSSTNDWAAQIIASGITQAKLGTAKTKPPEGTVVRAANQTAGRGQLGSHWHSAAGENLLLSIIFYPGWLEAQAQFYLSMAMALGVNDLLASLGHAPPGSEHSIKWPNDLYLNGRKTAGILIQNAISGTHLQHSIVGIGLNVNQVVFPSDLSNATSLALAFGQKLDLDALAEQLFECLERRYLQLKAGNRAAIKTEYEEHLWRRGKSNRFVRSATGQEFEGTLLGITERGLLRLQVNDNIEEFEVKQLAFVV